MSTDPVAEVEADNLPPNQSAHEFITEADAFQGMIALGEKICRQHLQILCTYSYMQNSLF